MLAEVDNVLNLTELRWLYREKDLHCFWLLDDTVLLVFGRKE
jgi:hypothetical protein